MASTVPWNVIWFSASLVCAVEMAGADISTPTHVTHSRSCFAMQFTIRRRNAGDTGAPRAGCHRINAGQTSDQCQSRVPADPCATGGNSFAKLA